MHILGIILLLISALLFYFSRRSDSTLYALQSTDRTTAGALISLRDDIAADLPDGLESGYHDYVSLRGSLRSKAPVVGPYSDRPAALILSEHFHVIEKREVTRDKDDQEKVVWNRKEESLSKDRLVAPIFFDDGTGAIPLKLDNNLSGIDLETRVDRFEPLQPQGDTGGGMLEKAARILTPHLTADTKSLGHRYVEKALPLDTPIFILAETVDTADEGLILRRPGPDQKNKTFMVSLKSSDEKIAETRQNQKNLKIGSIVTASLGALFVIGHFL